MSNRVILSGDIIQDDEREVIGLVICSQRNYVLDSRAEYFKVLFFNSQTNQVDLTCIFADSCESVWKKV